MELEAGSGKAPRRAGRLNNHRGRPRMLTLQGRQYPLQALLCLTLAAMVSGADDLMAVFRWGRRLPTEALGQFGLTQAPCHATYHYFFKAFDVASAEQVLGVWSRDGAPLGHVAIDGKRLRGSAPGGHDGCEGVHLVSAFASRLRAVVGQMRVDPGANEITMLRDNLDGGHHLDCRGTSPRRSRC